MPTISTFYGIIVRMFYDEHGPPHFRVAYQGYDAVIEINSFEVNGVDCLAARLTSCLIGPNCIRMSRA
jgi:hypothetical protein